MKKMKTNIFWFRRDLRLDDNHALCQAINSGFPVLPVFIFDTNIIDELQEDDPRITFIYETLSSINRKVSEYGSSVLILKGDPESVWEKLVGSYEINTVFVNKDYEPYAIQRDNNIEVLLKKHGIGFLRFKDQVIFEECEILKSDSKPYTVFTPYKNRWLKDLEENLPLKRFDQHMGKRLSEVSHEFPAPEKLGFKLSSTKVKSFELSAIQEYHKYRDYPAADKTTYLGPHLRFGTISIRRLVDLAMRENQVFLNELVWREFFMQILFSFPRVVTENFKPKFDNIQWRTMKWNLKDGAWGNRLSDG